MSILVHHLEHSRSLRILWMLEELGLDYEIRSWKRDANLRASPEAAKIHPLGRFPMIEVDGMVLAESGAILEYFADREGKLRPTEPDALREYRFFLHYAEGSVLPPLLVQLVLDRLKHAPLPFFIKPVAKRIAAGIESAYSRPQIDLHFKFIDETLGERPFFAGEAFSMADVQMFYAVEAGLNRGAGDRPHLRDWRARMVQREAYLRAEDKGGPAMPPRAQ